MIIPFLFRLILAVITIGLLLASVLIIIQFYFSKLNTLKNLRQNKVVDEEQKIILPLRLQAYERIILFLERISPNTLIPRILRPEMNALQLRQALISTIREEFEYNLSQQLYISTRAWELVKNAKEEMVKSFNIAGAQVNDYAPSGELARIIFEKAMGEGNQQPLETAVEEVKKEIQKLF
ncbi:MAG: hypothetical protein NTX61_07985 [Bacteroidetes bacterium]|nr:hypothetical protein [Bacteroidota bacterium]